MGVGGRDVVVGGLCYNFHERGLSISLTNGVLHV